MSINTSRVSQILTIDGDFDRPIQGRRWPVPKEVSVSGDRLCWTINAVADEAHPSKGLLEKFWQLGEAPDRQILAFAKRHGVLGICGHELPRTHRKPSCMPSGFSPSPPFNGEFWEPIPVWRKLA